VRLGLALVATIIAITPAHADPPLICTISFQGYRVCSGPGGYRSTEWEWHGRVIGADSDGRHWTTNRWRDGEITTVEPGR
jgi:hypothetical protein